MYPASTESTVEDVIVMVTADLAARPLDLKPKSMNATAVRDGLGEDAWQVTIVLPKPDGATWDAEALFAVRRTVVDAFDGALEGRLVLPGQTLAVVTTDEADPADIAAEETPVEGEDPSGDASEKAT
ncbi:hypothetical protein BKD30_02500 [Tersicoccus phoenicis]|uniref:Uncharacterized protein n=2 Tax=Tersicoccus phoenicis TaxID=554083 RepID=A0A1R1LK28_9MICC|nr:hypothetical protein BKD30_02500 [Tersicoccus phoenicis]